MRNPGQHLHAHALRDGRDLLRVSSVAIGLMLWLHYRLALGLRMLRRSRGERRGLILHVLGVRRERNWADVWIYLFGSEVSGFAVTELNTCRTKRDSHTEMELFY